MIRSVLVLMLFEVMCLDEKCLVSSERNELAHILQVDSSKMQNSLGFKEGEIKDILTRLNYFRRHPPATSNKMIKLMWNEKLAEMAEKWGKNCPNMRGPKNCLKFINQNIYMGSEIAINAIQSWGNYRSYNYTENNCKDNDLLGCLNYKALFWAESHSVGCSMLTCPPNNLLICNFYPGGNVREDLPFEVGGVDCNPSLCPPQAQKCDTDDRLFSLCEMTSVPEIPDDVINCAQELKPNTTINADSSGHRSTSMVEKKITKLAIAFVMMITNLFYIHV
ncbi:GLIPR1-like protein 1 [Centruroides sculpturatus]|uniref:GLIPR1-like protein 1 n=1 Tax=Centruroides sculpturatus TaxID=218467 RepID=UPI000C6D9DC1|nr:GLIPR1-like protein 1 [Centruroides sculpturatus]